MLLANTYTVIQNGTGDFTTIQAAINFVVDDDEIIVYEGTYNEQIYFLGKNILVASRYHTTGNEQYIDNTVISYQSNPFLGVVNFSNSEIYSILKGFTIEDGYIGVKFSNCDSPVIENCIITENTTGVYVRFEAGFTYPQPNIIDNKIINNENCGIFCADDTYPDIAKNLIKNNTVGIIANGVDIDGEERICFPTISYNIFENNDKGIVAEFAYSEINGNLFMNNQYVFHLYGFSNNLLINNCTINENQQLIVGALGGLAITNSIIRNLTVSISSNLQINYTNVEGGYNGTGNIDVNPKFCMNEPYEYYLYEGSPCIDAGDINEVDADGTRRDMGCYPSTTDIKPTKGHIWNWVSFPRLNVTQPGSYNASDLLINTLPSMPDLLTMIDNENYALNYDYVNGWTPSMYNITSNNGYKLKPYGYDPYILPEPGNRLASDHTKALTVGENWVGYWLPQTQYFLDALGDQADYIDAVYAENWFAIKTTFGWLSSSQGKAFEYGKGYIFMVSDPFGLQYIDSEISEPFEKPETELFAYEDKPSYEAIEIESIENGENVVEIGVYQGDVCIGASKVDEFPVQLLAYTDEVNRSSGLSFELATGRGETQRIETVQRFNFETGEYETVNLRAFQNKFSLIKLGKDGDDDPQSTIPKIHLTNYPNPFNPTTMIFFSVTQNSDFVTLEIYNIKGQKIRQLVNGELPAGEHTITWDGTDSNNKPVSSGIYLYRLKSGDQQLTRKMIMMK